LAAKVGKKNYYDSKIKPNLDKIEHWLKEGYSHKQICNMLSISQTTLYKYSNKDDKVNYKKEFADILRNGKDILEIGLVKALYKEAMGYEYTETHIEIEEDEVDSIKKTKKKQKKITKYCRANGQLLIFALCNKFPNKWKRIDKEVVEAIEEGKLKLDITDKHIEKAFKSLYPAINNADSKKIASEARKKNQDEK
jgi:hypothetical protein